MFLKIINILKRKLAEFIYPAINEIIKNNINKAKEAYNNRKYGLP